MLFENGALKILHAKDGPDTMFVVTYKCMQPTSLGKSYTITNTAKLTIATCLNITDATSIQTFQLFHHQITFTCL